MEKSLKLIAGTLLFALTAASVPSCTVDQLYSSENIESLDTGMTLFQDGLEIPLGTTQKIRVDSILDATGVMTDSLSKYLKVTDDGSYLIQYAGNYCLDTTLANLGLSDLDIDGVSVNEEISFDISGINADDLKVEPTEFGKEVIIDDLTEKLNSLHPEPVEEFLSVDAGIAGADYGFTIGFQPVNSDTTILKKYVIQGVASFMEFESFEIPSQYTPDVKIPGRSITIPSVTLPEQIKSVKEVVLKPSARISVKISVVNCLLTEGEIHPSGSVDLGDIIEVDGKNFINLSEFKLSSSNNFEFEKSYYVTKVNASALDQSNTVSVSGIASLVNAKTTKTHVSSVNGDMLFFVEVAFIDCELDHVVCEINPYTFETGKEVKLTIDPIELPEQVKSVSSVSFDSSSELVFSVIAKNASKISGISAKADITVEFPESMHISGEGVDDGKLVITGADITAPIQRSIRMESIDIPAPVGGKVGYEAVINLNAKAVASGIVNSKDIPADLDDDVRLEASLSGSINIEDYAVRINSISEEVEVGPETIEFEVSDAVGDFGTFTVYPKGTPALTLDLVIPDTGSLEISAGDGIVVTLPDMVVFGSVPPALNYNAEQHSILLKDLSTSSYNLPIEKLVITPKKDAEGKLKAASEYGVHGVLTILESDVNKSTAEKLSGATFKVVASLPEIMAESVQMDRMSFDVSQTEEFTLLDASSLPEELVSISEIELDGNFIDIEVELDGLPDIGDSDFMTDLTVTLPDFINPSTIVINKKIQDGKISVHEALNKLDLSGFDFPALRTEGKSISDRISIEGKVYADAPNVDLATISETVTGSVKAKVGDPNAKICIKSVTGKVDYKINFETGLALSDLFDGLQGIEGLSLDLPAVDVSLDVLADLAIPINASAVISAEGIPSTEVSVEFPFSEDGSMQEKHNSFELDLNPYLNADPMPDSLKLAINGAVDKTRDTYLELDKEYHASVDYKLELPISLGADFKYEGCDTLSLGDAGKYIGKSPVGLRGTVESTLPLGVKLELQLLSIDKQSGATILVPLKDKAILDIPAKKTSQIEVNLLPAGGENIPEPTDLRLVFTISSSGETLAESDYLQAKLSAFIPEGITIDPSSL